MSKFSFDVDNPDFQAALGELEKQFPQTLERPYVQLTATHKLYDDFQLEIAEFNSVDWTAANSLFFLERSEPFICLETKVFLGLLPNFLGVIHRDSDIERSDVFLDSILERLRGENDRNSNLLSRSQVDALYNCVAILELGKYLRNSPFCADAFRQWMYSK